RGPGTGLELPPITALVLSRSTSRARIPQTIIEMREDYAAGRSELWSLLTEMWTAQELSHQQKYLKKLIGLGQSIFTKSFGRTFDAISLGLELGKLSPAGITGFLDKGRQQ